MPSIFKETDFSCLLYIPVGQTGSCADVVAAAVDASVLDTDAAVVVVAPSDEVTSTATLSSNWLMPLLSSLKTLLIKVLRMSLLPGKKPNDCVEDSVDLSDEVGDGVDVGDEVDGGSEDVGEDVVASVVLGLTIPPFAVCKTLKYIGLLA